MQNSDPYIISHSELQSKDPQTTTVERLPSEKNLTTDSLNLDLLALQKEDKLNGTTLITVHNDPVYHSTKGTKQSLYIYGNSYSYQNLDTEKPDRL
jgi:hypothetical protein